MPVKRRTAKRRVSPEREYIIWESLLLSGADFFGELPELGLEPESGTRGGTPIEPAREAWARYGRRILAELPNRNSDWHPWALTHFREPK
jgi:hypothetical protein